MTASHPLPGRPGDCVALGIAGASLHRCAHIHDQRGDLVVGEADRHLPFVPRRWFTIFGVPTGEIRGYHAHKACHQFLVCLRGSCTALVDDGRRGLEIRLDAPDLGLYMPPLTWGTQKDYSADALLMVFASHGYDRSDYIEDREAYVRLMRERTP